ncbi:MAG: hypothetical protein ACQR33_01625 [Candidatus Saccharibacteria bacterium]
MSQDEFTKLYKYMEKRFDRIEAELATKASAEQMYTALDAIMKRLGIEEDERLALTAQVDRHQTWIQARS